MHHKLYIARREARLSQIKVSKFLNISNATYSLKENGKADFTLSEARKLANYFGCTLNDLFQEEETA
ncbi:helix-turn-helix transcriptional regulator [Sporosarcina sp. A2]|uniref:helix-turn-helix transcriptional regulator n=1 Tax=Sporosarcina sp. A2 TaxID=3393449 RepID=UPI003D7B2F74